MHRHSFAAGLVSIVAAALAVLGTVSIAAAAPAKPRDKPQTADREAPLPAILSTAVVKPPRTVKAVQPGFLWIDAGDFADYGGWKLDTQFVHLVGSAYLLAPGVGVPVKDATTRIDIPNPGKYRLWVRSKNWHRPEAPGRFQVLVHERPAAPVFGTADTEAWIWQSGGEFDLPAGPVRLTLHDLTGYFARCDALLLTTDLRYNPPHAVEAIVKERSRLTGLSLDPAEGGQYDVIVVGGGAAGCCAAIASARLGARTALIHDRPVLGGNSSIELGVPIDGAGQPHPNARESGIIEEAGRIKARFHYVKMSEAFLILAQQEKNLSVFLNRRVIGADMQSSPGDPRRRGGRYAQRPAHGLSRQALPGLHGRRLAGLLCRREVPSRPRGAQRVRREFRSRESRPDQHERLRHEHKRGGVLLPLTGHGPPGRLHAADLGRQAAAGRQVRTPYLGHRRRLVAGTRGHDRYDRRGRESRATN